ncbi:K(+)/H(+) antiporter, partial [Podila epigama]
AVVIIGLCYVLHLILQRLKQPRVISEVIAGILLGPSVMGRIPGFASTIFNPKSLPFLNLVSNIGLVFFLFLVGLELDPKLVVKRAKFALGISFAGMVLPFGVGAAVSYILYEQLDTGHNVGFGQFLLFCGVAMAITAFPVLARILAEQKLLTTKVGFLTICAGAVGDIVAWILLALVVSIINSESRITPLYVVLLSIGWILILVFAIRPMFNFMIRRTKSEDEPSQTMMAFTMAVVLISAFVTDIIGVHAIFGSFLVGLIIPNDTGFADGVTKRIEDLVSVIFLPIYFALSGLKTQVGLLDNAKTWGLVVLVTFVACFGKIVGCTSAARIQGMEWRESLAIGVLMNCKGLIELIVLNIGYDAGVINARVFVIMVAMCLITTCMTTPMVAWIYPPHYQRASALRALAKERGLTGDIERAEANARDAEADAAGHEKNKSIMLCLDKIQNLPAMMTFLGMFYPEKKVFANVADRTGGHHRHSAASLATPPFEDLKNTAAATTTPTVPSSFSGPALIALRLLHLTERSSSVLMAATERAEVLRRDTLMVVFQAFAKLNGIQIQPRMTLSMDPDDFAQSIYDEAVESGADTIIFPWNTTSLQGHSSTSTAATTTMMADDFLNDAALLPKPLVASNTQVLSRLLATTVNTTLTTAVFVDREFGGAGFFSNLMVPLYGSVDDEEAVKLASTISRNKACKVTLVRVKQAQTSTEAVSRETRLDLDDQSIHSKSSNDSEDADIDDNDNDALKAPTGLPHDNQDLVHDYFPHRTFLPDDKRRLVKTGSGKGNNEYMDVEVGLEVGENLFVHEAPTLQDAIGLCKLLLGSRDLLVLGRGSALKPSRWNSVNVTGQSSNAPEPYTSLGGASSGNSNDDGGVGTSTVLSAAGSTPTRPMETTSSMSNTHADITPLNAAAAGQNHGAVGSEGGLRSRHPLRSQPSSRDIHQSNLTVVSVLGSAAQLFLTHDVTSCLLVVQSGKKRRVDRRQGQQVEDQKHREP